MIAAPHYHKAPLMSDTPRGELTTRTLAMPADQNPAGDIFGGWVLSQMDIAGGILAHMSIASLPIWLLGSAEQKERFLRPALSGQRPEKCCRRTSR